LPSISNVFEFNHCAAIFDEIYAFDYSFSFLNRLMVVQMVKNAKIYLGQSWLIPVNRDWDESSAYLLANLSQLVISNLKIRLGNCPTIR